MFERARRRLTVAYIAMFTVVMSVFTLAFLGFVAIVLQPNFDLASDTSPAQVAQIAYQTALQRIVVALIAADILAVVVVGLVAWVLAARTLRPIRDAHERQRRFVADASHEMRTPLTAIRATTDNSLRQGASPAEQRAALVTVAAAAADLATLTGDLLTLAQATEGALRETEEPFDLSIVVAERLALRAAANSPNLAKVSFAPDLLVRGSAEEIGRIVDNLVDNAFRYGGPDVHVRVNTAPSDRQAVLDVADDGPGIAPADQARLFEPFFRARSDAGAPPGTGLGLAIAAALAQNNHGHLTVKSEPGRGSAFRLALPLAN